MVRETVFIVAIDIIIITPHNVVTLTPRVAIGTLIIAINAVTEGAAILTVSTVSQIEVVASDLIQLTHIVVVAIADRLSGKATVNTSPIGHLVIATTVETAELAVNHALSIELVIVITKADTLEDILTHLPSAGSVTSDGDVAEFSITTENARDKQNRQQNRKENQRFHFLNPQTRPKNTKKPSNQMIAL
jgi:hypothetical protein